jgi:UDP-N-acetylmuramoyl-tripeptide--D-alanyl-D-alanine ligase
MSELGDESESGHREVGECAAELGIDVLIAVGPVAAEIAHAAERAGLEKSYTVDQPEKAAELLSGLASPGDLILIKGSRSARMEKVIEAFAKRPTTAGVAP